MKPAHRYLLAILLIAAILRVIGLQNRGIWYDDAFSILLSQQSLSNIVAGTSADTMPPLYYFLLHFWMLFSRALWWTRLLNVLFSLATIWLLYRLVAGLASQRAGLWAAALAAIAPFHIYHAQELRSYALLGFFELAYLYFFSRLWLCPAPGVRRHWI
ncbi:MAG TPA: glycosyltransferase family 39 protein, partial [Anaerolineaceae bacterium]|nr:glycosyltransferase family 39 protein [Anaerolineaceae bacterium]